MIIILIIITTITILHRAVALEMLNIFDPALESITTALAITQSDPDTYKDDTHLKKLDAIRMRILLSRTKFYLSNNNNKGKTISLKIAPSIRPESISISYLKSVIHEIDISNGDPVVIR